MVLGLCLTPVGCAQAIHAGIEPLAPGNSVPTDQPFGDDLRLEQALGPAQAAAAAHRPVGEIIRSAARVRGVDPNLALAVSFWESGWRQDQVSSEGAVGLFQVMPKTAATAGPMFLGRNADINNPEDNALLGVALLKDLLGKYDPRTALAAYYQGEPAIQRGTYAGDTWRYADGILALAAEISSGRGPALPN